MYSTYYTAPSFLLQFSETSLVYDEIPKWRRGCFCLACRFSPRSKVKILCAVGRGPLQKKGSSAGSYLGKGGTLSLSLSLPPSAPFITCLWVHLIFEPCCIPAATTTTTIREWPAEWRRKSGKGALEKSPTSILHIIGKGARLTYYMGDASSSLWPCLQLYIA